MNARVAHFEIPADDVARAQVFYRDAFGWTINSMPEMDYALLYTTPSDENGMPTEPGGINGGMLPRQAPITSPVITIEVEDLDGTLARIKELGGKVALDKRDVAGMGFAAYFTDTEGNLVGLWQPA